MGLFEKLKTEDSFWRNNKFGRDRFDGGSSKEPFVNRNTLPGVTQDNPNLGLLGGNTDFLLRAGTLQRSADDVSRMSQLLLTTGKGVAFTAKQNLLSRTNVKTQAKSIGLNQGPYLPTSTIAQVGVSGIGFHLNKQGINPFAKTGTDSGDDGSGGNFFQNLLDAGSLPTYLSANVKGGDAGTENRLVQLRKFKLVGPQDFGAAPFLSKGSRLISNIAGGVDNLLGTSFKNKVSDLIPNVSPGLAANNISSAKNEILAYGGGPGSEIGVGRTRIKRYQDSTLYDTESFRKQYYLLDNGFIEQLSDEYVNQKGKIQVDFRSFLLGQQEQGIKKNILSNTLDYTRENIEQRVGLGNPGTNDKDLSSYVKGTQRQTQDKVNSLPLYQSAGVTPNTRKNDLIKFRIAAINPHDGFKKTYMHFRAFLDTFNDSYSSEWESFKYMGRSEMFYKYQGFTRDIALAWKLVAQSREELLIMYKKLNYLQSIMAGDYSPNGYMEGNLVDLTVGGYFWEQPGFFTSLTTTFPEDTTYEIGLPDSENRNAQGILNAADVRELPMYLNVSATFIPIQKFAPRKQQNEYKNGELQQYGRERFINLSNEGGVSSYDKPNNYDKFKPTSNTRKTPSVEVGQGDFGVSPDTGRDFSVQGGIDLATNVSNGIVNG